MGNLIELTTEQQLIDVFPIMNQLRIDLSLQEFLTLFSQMKKEAYQLFGWQMNDKIVGLAGVAFRTNLYNGRHLYIYDLITDEKERSKGYGDALLLALHSLAKENGAKYVALESGLQRIDAHRFYEEKMCYDKWCYSYRKEL
ncbi:GNAT family N-acetyltransferase [Mangrovibacillus cuniculi]|uniref:GNAT family N-acetyltransferase n=1 Tax=Mangrovibacillus cuniculi TaxID=2593652 RepID=A0A7S8C9M5_9BACI|nr:GNAT family N-acetyltransferase [Mangrovibacillus cuniculi]QPC45918.1 GNAT family N-acetyltransferase [Mangrovibacillus cuniculi]